ncbi:glycoside hydrolase family 6 protein [Nonomuraea sp. NPDC003560]|uniref:glycoside hydrolase family 6 protein n=1 Tax=Nonomuraea sp. NPDC003560 TaxID=3364341 RepID=UPI0036BB7192
MTLEALRDADPRQVGRYALLGRLGEGGMGVVYLGEEPGGTRVAVKLIHARMDADPDFRRRFAREVAAARRVARFCTAPVLDADVHADVAYLVTEYVEGPSLDDAVRDSGPLKGSALDGLAAAMAMALRAIHGAGIVHRDLKPSNVLLSQVGPKVIDFGIARLAESEMSSAIVGTPSYMSPEQVAGSQVGPASDIFSWGCTVAFAAGGLPPFGSGSVPTVLLRIVNEAPELRGLSGPLLDLVTASLAKSPAARPTAQDLMDALSTATPSAALPTPPPSPTTGTPPTVPPSPPAAGTPATLPPSPPAAGTPPTVPPSPLEGTDATTAGKRRTRLLAAAAAVVVAAAGVTTALLWPHDDTPASTRPATGTEPAATATPRNPLRENGVTFWSEKEKAAARQAAVWREDRPADAALMDRLAAVPHAIRLNQPEVRATVESAVTAAQEAGGVPVFLVNYMPGGGDCAAVGAGEMQVYQQWVKGVARQIGDRKAVIILEPSSLVNLPGTKDCTLAGTAEQRYRDLREAVQSLKTGHPGTAVYLDGSQDLYPGTEVMAQRLIGAGIDRADGFFVNTASFQPTPKAVEYGKSLSACIAVMRRTGGATCPKDADPGGDLPHFVVDTARNGQGSWSPTKKYKDPQTWCNPPGRGVGERPTTDTGEELADAYLWITRAGSSGGRCRRGTNGDKDPERGVVAPASGEWWADLALERAKNARPPLR